jgi:antitoxin (DNA-binding transcriptional repressor) of toxin-antitoxin stability system
MTTLTVQEASQGLRGWLRRAAQGEQIAISEGTCVVLLHPLVESSVGAGAPPLPREALRLLQAHPTLSTGEADTYLGEVREERLTDGEARSR